jgi:hypothetical protein
MYEKELILLIVMVPHEGTGDLDDLHVLPVELSNDSRIPPIVDRRKFFFQ